MYHVKATKDKPIAGLDLNIADEDEFSPDKLRANLERLYMTVIIGLMGFGKHIARLRSWREPRRTAAFLAVSNIVITLLTLLTLTGVFCSLDFRFHCAVDLCYHHGPDPGSTGPLNYVSTCSFSLG